MKSKIKAANFKVLCLFGALCCILSVSSIANARKIDWDDLKKKAQKYEKGGIDVSSYKNSGKVPALKAPPKSRVITNEPKMLTEKDKRHIKVHMKLANRNFSKKRYKKAIKELELVFERQPDLAGGRFMRAVIAARMKDYLTAWQNILIAKEKDSSNAKISSFIDKLKTRTPQPENLKSVKGIYRSSPKYSCELVSDLIEKILQDKVSENFTSIKTLAIKPKGNSALATIKIKSSAQIDKSKLVSLINNSIKTSISSDKLSNKNKELELTFETPELPANNPEIKSVSGLSEFVKMIAEETDVAIRDTIERDLDNKILDCTYEISARNYSDIGSFFRKAAKYAQNFKVKDLTLSYVPNSDTIIWSGQLHILFQTK
jgi:tetratricopeptide (TPR) repeat protein